MSGSATGECIADGEQLHVPTVKLANGVDMPVLSLGTSHVILESSSTDPDIPESFVGFLPERAYRQIQLALECGIRSFESARIYRTHRTMGRVLGQWFQMGQLERRDVFLTTKVFHGDATALATRNSHMWDMDRLTPEEVSRRVMEEVEDALVELGIGYIDLMLLHWPGPGNVGGKSNECDTGICKDEEENRKQRLAAWKVLEACYKKGWLRAIGVSNFSEHHIAQLIEDGALVTPMVNQIESSLSVHYPKIFEYCQLHGIVCQAFSPFKRGSLLHESASSHAVEAIANKYNKNIGQLALRYLTQSGYTAVFLSTSRDRMIFNHSVFDFELDEDEMIVLGMLPQRDGNWGLPTPYDIK